MPKTVTLEEAEINFIVEALDAFNRQRGMQVAQACVGIAAKLKSAKEADPAPEQKDKPK